MASKKVQLPVMGGLRKVVQVTNPASQAANPGTTITEFANQTVSLAQLKQALGIKTTASGNTSGGTAAALVPGQGLSGGGVLVGAVPIYLAAPIPVMLGEEGGQGEMGPPGQRGIDGVIGRDGTMGPPGDIGVEGPEGPVGPPGPPGTPGGPPGPTGATGPAGNDGTQGAMGLMGEQGEDGMMAIPGNQGPAGAIGPAGAAGLSIFGEDGIPGDMGPPGATGPAGTGGGSSGIASTILLHFDGTNGQTTTVDSSANAFAVTRVGSGALSNTQVKFGTTSTAFNATDGWSISAANFQIADAQCFTIDFWLYLTTLPGTDNAIIGQWNNTGPGGAAEFTWLMSYHTSGHLTFYNNNSFPTFSGPTVSLNTWHHVAIVRNGSTVYAFLDGALYGIPLTSFNQIVTSASNLQVGGMTGGAAGFMDELRIVKGVNVFNANFAVPTGAYTQ